MVASAASKMPTNSGRDTAGPCRTRPQSVRGSAGPDFGLGARRVVGGQHEAMAILAIAFDHDDDHAGTAVG